ncbi:MAG: CDP-glucose 4,6-dehydratase [Magnetococcales bacterium]|nr:CDP-glucose 4,6-dehydratase [Magnetococcales bacterium]
MAAELAGGATAGSGAELAATFAGRRVLITGHTGFKGSWLALWLHHWGARVGGFALPPETTPDLFSAAGVEGLLERHTLGDVRDFAALREAVETFDPQVIFHMAAQPLVLRGYREPRETVETNVMGTLNLLEAVRLREKPCAVVIITSDKCYANREQVWGYRECDPMGGDDPYSVSKGAAELLVHAWRRSYFPPERLAAGVGVALASARAGNVIGGGDWSENRLVPDLVRAMEAGEPLVLRHPLAVRPWQHVLDPLHGYLMLAARLLGRDAARFCDGWNFAPDPGDEWVTVGGLAERFQALFQLPAWRPDPLARPHEASMLRLAIDQSLVRLGWRPRWNVGRTIERTARWYQAFRPGVGAMRQACLDDLTDFLGEAPSPAPFSQSPHSSNLPDSP